MNVVTETIMEQAELHKRLIKEWGEVRGTTIMAWFTAIHQEKLPKEISTPELEADIQQSLDDALAALCPEPCAGIKPEFWDSDAGQLIAEVQFWLWGDDYIGKADAARILYGDGSNVAITNLRDLIRDGRLATYRRPDREMIQPRKDKRRTTRKGEVASPRTWLMRRSEVETLAKKRKTGE